MRGLDARATEVIRIDAVWLAAEPLDMRAGTDTAQSRVVQVFGSAKPHHAYLFANRRANRMKVLMHDGTGISLYARRLYQGRFLLANTSLEAQMALSRELLDALVLGLPLQRLGVRRVGVRHLEHPVPRLREAPLQPLDEHPASLDADRAAQQ